MERRACRALAYKVTPRTPYPVPCLADAAGGPLEPGLVGKIERVSGGRYHIDFNGSTWWYDKPR